MREHSRDVLGAVAIVVAAIITGYLGRESGQRGSREELSRLERQIDELQQQVRDKDDQLREKDNQLKSKDTELSRIASELSQLGGLIGASGARETSDSSGQEGDASQGSSREQRTSPQPPSSPQAVFENESYRAAVNSVRRQGTALRVAILFENVSQEPILLSWRGRETYLLGEDGVRWNLDSVDPAGLGGLDPKGGVQLGRVRVGGVRTPDGIEIPSKARIAAELLFSPARASSARLLDLFATESRPKQERPISFRGLHEN